MASRRASKAPPPPDMILVQTRIPRKVYDGLSDLVRRAGDVKIAPYLRRIITRHVREQKP